MAGDRRRRTLAALALGGLILLTPACAGDPAPTAGAGVPDAAGSPPPSGSGAARTDPSPPATDPVTDAAADPVPEQTLVLAAADGYWSSFYEATRPPDPAHPSLARYTAGPALERTRREIDNERQLNQEVRLPPGSRSSSRALSVTIDDRRAEVRTCVVDDSQLVDVPSGTVLNDEVVTTVIDLTLERRETWVVVDAVKQAEWPGVRSCAG